MSQIHWSTVTVKKVTRAYPPASFGGMWSVYILAEDGKEYETQVATNIDVNKIKPGDEVEVIVGYRF